jgi:hypothetical protein
MSPATARLLCIVALLICGASKALGQGCGGNWMAPSYTLYATGTTDGTYIYLYVGGCLRLYLRQLPLRLRLQRSYPSNIRGEYAFDRYLEVREPAAVEQLS